jgi:hypothetical protein
MAHNLTLTQTVELAHQMMRERLPNATILYMAQRGSKTYGTDDVNSDIDVMVVYAADTKSILKGDRLETFSNSTGDITFMEIGEFAKSVMVSAVNLECLFVNPEHIVFKHPLFQTLLDNRESYVSKRTVAAMGGFAHTELNSVQRKSDRVGSMREAAARKTILDFMVCLDGTTSKGVETFVANHGLTPEQCGLCKVDKAKGVYALYGSNDKTYNGIVCRKQDNIKLSSLHKHKTKSFLGYLMFNLEEWQKHCRKYRDQKQFEDAFNPARYVETETGFYNVKSLYQAVRVLRMAHELVTEQGFNVYRQADANELKLIKHGKCELADVIAQARALKTQVDALMLTCSLIESPDFDKMKETVLEIRLGLL